MPETQTSCRSGWRIRLADDVALLDVAGCVLTLRSRKGRALLAFLASAKGHESTRAILIGLLWSDRGHHQARASLRQCLFEIRSEAEGLIIVDGERIALVAAEVSDPLRYNGDSATSLVGLEHLDPAFDRWLAEKRALSTADGDGAHNAADAPFTAGVSRVPVAILRRRRAPAIATLVGAAALAAVWLALGRSAPAPAPGPPVIAMMPFAAHPDTPAVREVAARIVDDTRDWIPGDRATLRAIGFGQRSLPVKTDWVISREVASDGAKPLLRARIETPDGAVLWTQDIDVDQRGLARAATMLATRIASTVTCALQGPPRVRQPDIEALLLASCDKLDFARDGYSYEAALEAHRRLAERAPDDALGLAYYGTGLAVIAWNMPPAIAAAMRAQAQRLLDRAARLDPHEGEVWVGRYELIVDRRAYARREATLLHGLLVEPNNDHVNGFADDMMANVGRSAEALVYARRAAALSPARLLNQLNVIERLIATGQPKAADALAVSLLARYPGDHFLAWGRFDVLTAERDFAGARAMLEHADAYPDWLEPNDLAMSRLAVAAAERPQSSAANTYARKLLSGIRSDGSGSSQATLGLARTGRIAAAVEVATRYMADDTESLFDPAGHALLYDRRFPQIARFQGLWDYWERTGHWPDICRDPALQWKCGGTVKNASTPR